MPDPMSEHRKITMADVAQLAGVSPMTVSRALKPGTSVNAATREKIRAAADQLGYVVDLTAAAFSSRRSGFVAMTIPSINNANFADTARGLTEGLQESGLELMLGYTDYDVAEEERLVEAFLRRRPEAIVVTGGAHTERCRALLRGAAVPVVETWDLPRFPIDRVVGFSNAEAGARIARHLFDQGHRRIGFIGGNGARDTRGADRQRGFLQALAALGLPDDRQVTDLDPPITMREGARALERLLGRWPDTTAIMCVSDLSAFGAMNAALRRGLRVPQDLAVAGFGAYDVAEHAMPEITTIDAQAHRVGHEAARVILAALADPAARPETINLEISLLARASTATDQGAGNV
ncbi:MAG: LacI family DNA-binding transcriptional regulator [Pseudomonadota bacterium]